MHNRLNAKQKKNLNAKLHQLCKTRHQSIPYNNILDILKIENVECEEVLLFCGRDGSANLDLYQRGQEIDNAMLVLQWYKGETTYEINAYVS